MAKEAADRIRKAFEDAQRRASGEDESFDRWLSDWLAGKRLAREKEEIGALLYRAQGLFRGLEIAGVTDARRRRANVRLGVLLVAAGGRGRKDNLALLEGELADLAAEPPALRTVG